MKICQNCSKSFFADNKDGSENKRRKFCSTSCNLKDKYRRRYIKHKDKISKIISLRNIKRRNFALEKLGSKCVKCGITDLRVLQIDHIIPLKFTKQKRLYAQELHNLIIEDAHSNLQLLCANCHMLKTWR